MARTRCPRKAAPAAGALSEDAAAAGKEAAAAPDQDASPAVAAMEVALEPSPEQEEAPDQAVGWGTDDDGDDAGVPDVPPAQ